MTPRHRIGSVVAAGQPHAMVNDHGDVFYPDGPEDAQWFADRHGARPLHSDRFRAWISGPFGPMYPAPGGEP